MRKVQPSKCSGDGISEEENDENMPKSVGKKGKFEAVCVLLSHLLVA